MLQWGSKAYLLLRNNGKPFTFQNLTLEDETPNYGPRLGNLVHQLPGVVTLAYDLHFTRMIARWKDLSEDYDEKDDFFIKNIAEQDFPKNVV